MPRENNWVCAKCGRNFPRRWSGKRHIMKVENGLAALVTRAQYHMGVTTGMFIPTLPNPVYGKKHSADLMELVKQKLREKFVEELAERAMKNPESNERVTAMFVTELTHEQTRRDNDDEYSKLITMMSNLFRRT